MKKLRAFVTGLLLFAVLLVGVIGVTWAVGAEYQSAPETVESVSNESITADLNNDTAVDSPSYALRYYDNETVRNSTGHQLTEGSDYEWNTSTGEISWYNTSSVDDGEAMEVDYSYDAKTQKARTVKSVFSALFEVILPSSILVIVAMTVIALAAGVLSLFGGLSSDGGSASLNRR